jgi:hypothetical protein
MRLLYPSAILLLSACATPLRPDASVALVGDWEIVAVNGQRTGGGERFFLSLKPPAVSARFGCNAGEGSARVMDGWLLSDGWVITAAGCRPKVYERFEAKGFAVLSRPAAIERRSEGVRLRSERGSIDLRAMAP